MPSGPGLRGVFALLLVSVLSAGVAGASGKPGAEERYWPPVVDPATGVYTPGRWVWGDLLTSDVARAAAFYGAVFGWTFETYGGKDDRDTYTLALADGLPIGGLVYDQRAKSDGRPSARWIGFISVPDVQATAAAVTRGGGKVVLQPTPLGERGVTAVFEDPEGALFGAVRSKNGDPEDYSGDLNEWFWIDLWTDDVSKSAAFYRGVAGFDVVPIEGNEVRDGVRLVAGGYARAGIMQKHGRGTSTVWLPYVRVADVGAAVARARAAGGRVVKEPIEMPRAIVAIVGDPTGAPVGVVQLRDGAAKP